MKKLLATVIGMILALSFLSPPQVEACGSLEACLEFCDWQLAYDQDECDQIEDDIDWADCMIDAQDDYERCVDSCCAAASAFCRWLYC